jgi:hypothetical protein
MNSLQNPNPVLYEEERGEGEWEGNLDDIDAGGSDGIEPFTAREVFDLLRYMFM